MKLLSNNTHGLRRFALASLFILAGLGLATTTAANESQQTAHKTITVDGVEVFYREAGPADAPTILLLHGFPTIQLALFYDYQNNVPHYPAWQEYFRQHQPPTLIVWGQNDYIFPADGAYPYKRDLQNLEFHLLDTGHFSLEEDGQVIATLMRDFLNRQLASPAVAAN